MSAPTSEEKKLKFIDLYAAGTEIKKIKETLGISVSAQHRIRKELGLPLRNRKAKREAVEKSGKKICSGKGGCGVLKPLTNFYFRKSRNTYEPHCKRCSKKKQKARQSTEKFKEWNRNRIMQLTYGISYQQYLEMEKSQGGVCGICKRPNSSTKRRLYIDHCHTTGHVRGLLCNKCNSAIGLLDENIDYMKSAIQYLIQARAVPVPA